MQTFHYLKYKAYPRDRLSTSKGVIRNKELALATPKGIKAVSLKQEVTTYKMIMIRTGVGK